MTDSDRRVLEYPARSRDIQRRRVSTIAASGSGRRLLGFGALLLIGGLGVWRLAALRAALEVTVAQSSIAISSRASASKRLRASPGTMSVTLPATTNAFQAANIYARASGYITERNVDIGSRVKAGDLLAAITAPGVDHQIAQAEASLAQAKAFATANQGEPRTGPGHLGARLCSRQARLGHPNSRRHRSPELCGSAAGEAG